MTSVLDITDKNKKSLPPIEDSMSSSLSIENPSTTLIPIEHTSEKPKQSKANLKESLQNLETILKKIFYPDEGIDEEIVKTLYRYNMPSEIVNDENLFDSNYNRVVQQLKSLGGQKRSKYADPEIDKHIKAISFYNKELNLLRKV